MKYRVQSFTKIGKSFSISIFGTGVNKQSNSDCTIMLLNLYRQGGRIAS